MPDSPDYQPKDLSGTFFDNETSLRRYISSISGFEQVERLNIPLQRVTESEALKALEQAPYIDLRHIFADVYDPKYIPDSTWVEIHRLQKSPFPQDQRKAELLRETVIQTTDRGILAELDPRQILCGNFNGSWKDFLYQRRGLAGKLALMTAFNTYKPGVYDIFEKEPPRILQLGDGAHPIYFCENGNNRVQASLVTGNPVYAQIFKPKYLNVPRVFSTDNAYQRACLLVEKQK